MKVETIHRAASDEGADRVLPPDRWSRGHTRILPKAFEGFDDGRTLNILDAGPLEPMTIDFLRRFRCRLYVADLLGPFSAGSGANPMREFLGAVDQVRFDICLLWDYVNYPDREAFADFVAALSGHVHAHTRLYAIGAYSAQLPLRACRYAIADRDTLAMRPSDDLLPKPRTRNDIVQAMRRYTIQRAALRRDNRLELLLGIAVA